METERTPLHNLSSRARRLQTSVDSAVTYDLLLAMWAALGGDDKSTAHALGEEWFDEFRTALSDRTRELAERVSPHGVMWTALLGVIARSPLPHDLDSALTWLADQDPVWLRSQLMEEHFCDLDPATAAAVVAGEEAAVDRMLESENLAHKTSELRAALRSSFLLPAAEVADGLVEVLRRAREEAFRPFESEWAAALERDAVDKRIAVANSTSPKDLIEKVTNGISFEVPPGVGRLVIIPSVSLRPWTLITDHDSALLVCCPVSEEAINSDPEAPPSWLVATYRALGDDKRLRLLRRLSDSPASLAELTEFMGMAKSTVFHHIGVLRAAGLVRVEMNEEQSPTYSLRLDSIPDRDSLLDHYLKPLTKEAKP
jgi:DNA-binding transcriptional ArsR family regulator